MSYWEMDDNFLGHHKTRRATRAGWEALGMWFAMRTYVALNLTDGVVPDDDIDDLPNSPKNPRKWLKVLVECGRLNQDGTRGAGLVDPHNSDWKLHDYEHHALTRVQIEERKATAATRSALRASPELMAAVKARDASKCRYCGLLVNWGDRKGPFGGTYDHVVAITKGGQNTFENVVVACRGCNSRKHARTPEESGMKLLEPTGHLPVSYQTNPPDTSSHISHPIPSEDLNRHTQAKDLTGTPRPALQELCDKMRLNPNEASYHDPRAIPELAAVADEFWKVLKRTPQRLGVYQRDSGVRALCELFADGYTRDELIRAVRAIPGHEWAKKLKRPDLAILTPALVRQLLDDSPDPEEAPLPKRFKTLDDIEREDDAARATRDRTAPRVRPPTNGATPLGKPRPGATSTVSTKTIETDEQRRSRIEAKRIADHKRLEEFEEANATT